MLFGIKPKACGVILTYIISACLCNFACRYDGDKKGHPELESFARRGLAVPVCPEVLGGLLIPRPKAEITRDLVLTETGRDVTREYVAGAYRSLYIGLQAGCDAAILKARSPSCGLGRIYDGTFSSKLIPGDGIFARLLLDYGFRVFTEETFCDGRAARPNPPPVPDESEEPLPPDSHAPYSV